MGELRTSDFSLKNTLESGQFFRFQKHNNGYLINTRDLMFYAEQDGDRISYDGVSKKFIETFFSLDYKHNLQDKRIRQAMQEHPGIRIVRQDPGECLVSYICSSFSNIKKIQKNVELLSQNFGKKIFFNGIRSFAFPEPGKICNMQKIQSCKVGYRAKYIFDVNKVINKKFIKDVQASNYTDAKKKLMSL